MKERRGKKQQQQLLLLLTVSRHCHADRWPPSGNADYKVRVKHLLAIRESIRDEWGWLGWDQVSVMERVKDKGGWSRKRITKSKEG